MRAWGLSIVVAALGALGALNAPALAQGDVYRVADVPARAEAISATEARSVALSTGQVAAFERLLLRLTLPEEQGFLGFIDPELAANLVTELGFSDERTSATTWSANLTVSFDPAGVRNYLRSRRITPVESVARPGVVLPVLSADGTSYVLWDQTNAWLDAWLARSFADEQVPILSPLGDVPDVNAISAIEVQQLDPSALGVFAARYQVERVYIARAFINPTSGFVTGQLEEIDFASADSTPVTVARANGQTFEEVRDQLAERVVGEWKQAMAVRDPRESTVEVTALFDTLDEWLELQQILGSAALVVEPSLKALAGDGATMSWRYRGRPDQLQRELREKGAALSARPEDGGWQVETTARAARRANVFDPSGTYDGTGAPAEGFDATEPGSQPAGRFGP